MSIEVRHISQFAYYAGIGSRNTPTDILALMAHLAKRLGRAGYTLRSGGAHGADSAFERGCAEASGACEIWLPWRGFNGHPDTGLYPTERHMHAAELLHPLWHRLGRGPRTLHARNVAQVVGMTLDDPVEFVLCWTPDGCEHESERTEKTGGTATAIVLASRMGIPVFNLQRESTAKRLGAHLRAAREARAMAQELNPGLSSMIQLLATV